MTRHRNCKTIASKLFQHIRGWKSTSVPVDLIRSTTLHDSWMEVNTTTVRVFFHTICTSYTCTGYSSSCRLMLRVPLGLHGIHSLHTQVGLSNRCVYVHVSRGKWKTLKCGNRSAETEVRKPKYGSEKKSRLSVSSALLTHDCAL